MEKAVVTINDKSIEFNDIRISSRDVIQMMGEPRHHNLTRKIDSMNKVFEKSKMISQEYWIENEYKVDGNNKTYKEYLISKKGCELLAHKSTGEKGVLFTVKYMERFEEMEKALLEQNSPSYMIDDPIKRAQKWIEECEEKNRLLAENQIKTKQLDELEPIKEYHDKVLLSPKLITSTDIAKDLGISSISLHRLLNKKGIIFRRDKHDKTWKFYHSYQHMVPEYADYHITGHSQNLKWTEKGRKFIIDLVENDAEAKALLNEYRTIHTNPKKRKNKKVA